VPRRKKERKEAEVIMNVTYPAYVEPDKAVMSKDVQTWASEAGLRGPFRLDGPTVEKFPRHGHGYTFQVRELSGKQRMATARYTYDGNRSFWQQDGMVTG
jgi:hypothetical protein